jgi:hypothetical protein
MRWMDMFHTSKCMHGKKPWHQCKDLGLNFGFKLDSQLEYCVWTMWWMDPCSIQVSACMGMRSSRWTCHKGQSHYAATTRGRSSFLPSFLPWLLFYSVSSCMCACFVTLLVLGPNLVNPNTMCDFVSVGFRSSKSTKDNVGSQRQTYPSFFFNYYFLFFNLNKILFLCKGMNKQTIPSCPCS